MTQQRISNLSAVVVQGLMICFFIPFDLSLAYGILGNGFSVTGVTILIVVFIISFIAVRGSLYYSDVYLKDKTIIVKKIVGSRQYNISEIKAVKNTLIPSVCSIVLLNNKKVYFMIKFSDMLTQIVNMDPESALRMLNEKLQQANDS